MASNDVQSKFASLNDDIIYYANNAVTSDKQTQEETESTERVRIKIGFPPMGRYCLGRAAPIRNPLPPATIMAYFFMAKKL